MITIRARLQNNAVLNYCPTLGFGHISNRSINENEIKEALNEAISIHMFYKPIKSMELLNHNIVVKIYSLTNI